METQKAFTLHSEHTAWINKLNFYVDDLAFMQKRLEELVSRNTNKDLLALADHFQNQFIMRKEQIDEMRHAINDHETYVENKVSTNNSADHVSLGDHTAERNTIEGFEKAYAEMRHDYISFLSKVM